MNPTTVARLTCSEKSARRIADMLSENLDAEDTVCAAFEGDDGRWQVAIHFRHPPDDAALRALLRDAGYDAAADALAIAPVEDADWVARSLAGLQPVRAGRFVVHGAHDRARVPVNAIGIEIEAALAFGTGHHGTTRGCLLALDAVVKCVRDRKPNVLDLGTGTGVLAIAAARAFRKPAVSTDIDPVAVAVARGNARLNRADSFITFRRAAGTRSATIAARAPYDLIFANILLGPLMRMAQPVSRLAAPGAHVVLSGLLPAHAHAALAAYRAQGLALERRIPVDGWMTLVLRRRQRTRPAMR